MKTDVKNVIERKKPCLQCGAELLYAPGTSVLKCSYCSFEQKIKQSKDTVEELKLMPFLQEMGTQSHSEEVTALLCHTCGAKQQVQSHIKSLRCVYCSSSLVLQDAKTEQWILPGALVPFNIEVEEAHRSFRTWVKGLWFAPGALKKATLDPLNTSGLYLPFWTFDAQMTASYTGKRGEYYYENQVVGSGSKRRTTRRRRTQWHQVSGVIKGFVDDTLILAANTRNHTLPQKIRNWDLSGLRAFESSYLKGYTTEKYSIALDDGHKLSKKEVEQIARQWIRHDIGGDTQQIDAMDIKLSEETFKHVLLPVFISSYRYKGKVYQFYVNGQNGVTSGSRPFSVWKITAVVLLAVILLFLLFS